MASVSNPHNDSALQVHSLSVFYGDKPALWEIDFELQQGRKIGILGPNGSGKSTLMKTIMGLIKPASGYVKILGEPLDNVRSRIAYVPQKESVDWDFPITVKEVVQMGRYKPNKLFGRLSKLDKELALKALEQLKISDLADRHIAQLSGGQQQRVFLARAICQEADIYFMDEPFTGVDAATEETIISIINELAERGKTIIMVHHDLNSARDYFDDIVMLNTRLICCGETSNVYNQDNIKNAFGSQLTILSEIGNKINELNYPVREAGEKDS